MAAVRAGGRNRWLRGAAACRSCRMALVRSCRYFLEGRGRLAQAVAGSLAGRPRCRCAGSVLAQEQDGKHDDHDDYDCCEADKHGVLLWCLWGEGLSDPAEPGGEGLDGGVRAALLMRTGICRLSYLVKASLAACLAAGSGCAAATRMTSPRMTIMARSSLFMCRSTVNHLIKDLSTS